MTKTFFEQPILNGPYAEPALHHALDADGQPSDEPPRQGRRLSSHISPVPRPRRRGGRRADAGRAAEGPEFDLHTDDGVSSAEQDYNPSPVINKIRDHLKVWRAQPEKDWGVTPVTARLLKHWRSHDFQSFRPFFCQVEAAETIIWLTEAARPENKAHKEILDFIKNGNAGANPELMRHAMKMATGAGKTTVMAMLIAWQTVNAVRASGSKMFSKGFLIVTPGITIKDRLRVLQPNDPGNYYKHRELVPADMLADLQKAKIVITNYHAFLQRETMEAGPVSKALLQGRRGEPVKSRETEGQMVRRAAGGLMGLKNIVIINDEAHHCYRENPKAEEERAALTGDEKKDAEEQTKAARLWINGVEAFKRKLGVRAVYDLSATPFFLSGSGWGEGTLFPWTVSDFSLMDAIESGIVKLPRIPVADNITEESVPVFRNLWAHIGKTMPKKGGQQGDPQEIPDKLQTALHALYGHYNGVYEQWERAGEETPPVFIVVCSNTSTSRLVYEWISGWRRANQDGDMVTRHHGNLDLFSNFDEYGEPLPRPKTLLIDSRQIESGGELDASFRKIAADEIEAFKRERLQRSEDSEISDSDLLREAMNTVGKPGKLGGQIRCVVSVSMLTEGWDANTVTHILGVRAFGTQLLCEQVVGRALRRLDYTLDETGLFRPEYADILGIPFDFTAKPVLAPPRPKPKLTRVEAVPARAASEIRFPCVTGYRVDLPQERLTAQFTKDSVYVIDHAKIGASRTDMAGIVGEGHTLNLEQAQNLRPSTIIMNLTKDVLYRYYCDEDGEPKLHLFNQIKNICRRWLDEGYLKCPGGTGPWMLSYYAGAASGACEKIAAAISRADEREKTVKAVIDPYNPEGSTRHTSFTTTREVFKTGLKCHVNCAVLDSGWEAEFARAAENHPRVLAYVKNQGNSVLRIPYKDGGDARNYLPDFIVKIDDGRGAAGPLNLVVEIKGFQNENAKLKKETAEEKWIPGVNALKTGGRWAFAQFESVFEIEREFGELISRVTTGGEKGEAA